MKEEENMKKEGEDGKAEDNITKEKKMAKDEENAKKEGEDGKTKDEKKEGANGEAMGHLKDKKVCLPLAVLIQGSFGGVPSPAHLGKEARVIFGGGVVI